MYPRHVPTSDALRDYQLGSASQYIADQVATRLDKDRITMLQDFLNVTHLALWGGVKYTFLESIVKL